MTAPAAAVRTWLHRGRGEAMHELELSLQLRSRGLPRRPVEAIFPVENVQVTFACPGRYASQDVYGMACLAVAAAAEQPKKILEIGTFRGATARVLAANAPDATVYTLDLPPGNAPPRLPMTCCDDEIRAAGRERFVYEGTPEAERIVQLWGDSAAFDFDTVGDGIDLAFIDGAHSYEYVRNDTEHVLPRMRPGGVVIWDDYSDLFPGVVRYLNELVDHGLSAVLATDLVVWRVPERAD